MESRNVQKIQITRETNLEDELIDEAQEECAEEQVFQTFQICFEAFKLVFCFLHIMMATLDSGSVGQIFLNEVLNFGLKHLQILCVSESLLFKLIVTILDVLNFLDHRFVCPLE